MLGTTIYRNQPGISNKFIAQVGYFLTAMVAAVETIAALVFSTLAFALLLFSKKTFEHSTKWLSSSAFSFAWSFVYFTLNFFILKLVADEKSACKILQSRGLTKIPYGAILH